MATFQGAAESEVTVTTGEEKRLRKPTEKGLSYTLETKHRVVNAVFKKLRRQCSEMNTLMSSDVDNDIMRENYTSWMTLYENYLDAHSDYCNLLPTDEKDTYLNDDFALKEVFLCTFKGSVEKWFSEKGSLHPSYKTVDQIGAFDSVSAISRKSRESRRSRVSSLLSCAKLKEEQKSAELTARSAALKSKQELEIAKHDLESQRLALEMRQEQLELETERAINEAKQKVLECFDAKCSVAKGSKSERVSKLGGYSAPEVPNEPSQSVLTPANGREFDSGSICGSVSQQRDILFNNHKGYMAGNLNPYADSFIPSKGNRPHSVDKVNPVKVCTGTTSIMGTDTIKRIPINPDESCLKLEGVDGNNVNMFSPQSRIIQHVAFQPNANVNPEFVAGYNTSIPATADNIFASIVSHLKKPTADLKKFSGDPMEFRKFIRQFFTKIVANTEDVEERMNYLEQFTTGEPHRIVSGYSYLPAFQGYPAALQELEERYGNTEIIANAFVKKALGWNVIKHDKPKELDDFSIFLAECENAVKGIDAVRVLEYPENLKRLVAKLPFRCQEKWRGIVQQTRSKSGHITFHQLSQFVRLEARKANDPVYGRDALLIDNKPTQQRMQKGNPRGSFVTTTATVREEKERSVDQNFTAMNKTKNTSVVPKLTAFTKPCLYCKDQGHALENCKLLKALSFQDKVSELRSKGLCYGCLRTGHIKKDCRSKAVCEQCKGRHPTVFHSDEKPVIRKGVLTAGPDNKQSENTPFSACASIPENVTTCNEDCTLAIIPVTIKRKGGLKVLQTYAFLDPGSSLTFCTDEIRRELGAEGRKMTITLDTIGSSHTLKTYVVENLEVCDLHMENTISLPRVYTKDEMPVNKSHIPSKMDLNKWHHLQNVPLTSINANIGLLIGNNVPNAYSPLEVRTGPRHSPHATKTLLGWIPWNVIRQSTLPGDVRSTDRFAVNRIELKAIHDAEDCRRLDQLVKQAINLDFPEQISLDRKEYSQEDKRFTRKVNDSIQLVRGHYQICLPFRDDVVNLPNNSEQALQRLQSLKNKMTRNIKFRADYVDFMDTLLSNGYAEQVPESDLIREEGHTWYIPHHGVYHPHKPEKIRVVFDCSAKFHGISLNNQLLPGPDLTNNLLGVLLRFRKDHVALMGDVESMFYQVKVPEKDTDYLRFYWWPHGDVNQKPVAHRMLVHLFGAVSSPSCANAALRQTAKDNRVLFDPVITQIVERNFYVDDCLTSAENEEEAEIMLKSVSSLCKKGGFRLTKWISNSSNVISSVPESERAKELRNLDLCKEALPNERALGIHWSVEKDTLGFQTTIRDLPPTRRCILSIVSSVYDPLGFAAPFTLIAKQLLQDLCRRNLGWDETIDENALKKWELWLQDLSLLKNLEIPRCYKSENVEEVTSYQIHTFCDASELGYGTVTYLRLVDSNDDIHTSFVMGRARVAPIKRVTTPRMELTAAVVAVRVTNRIIEELDLKLNPSKHIFFWTDSMSVLRYIKNEKSRFKTFVANRVTIIREGSELTQRRYVNTSLNPADVASRGQGIQKFLQNRLWIEGPAFLKEDQSEWPGPVIVSTVSEDDEEVKKPACSTQQHNSDFLDNLCCRYGKWMRLKVIVARLLTVKKTLKGWVQTRRNLEAKANLDSTTLGKMKHLKLSTMKFGKKNPKSTFITIDMLNASEKLLVQHAQRSSFHEEIAILQSGKGSVGKSSAIYKLDVFLEDQVLRVGGRLQKSSLPHASKHQVVLPKDSPVSRLIVEESHRSVGHLGINSTLAQIRQTYWIVGARSLVKRLLSKCVICRKIQSRPGEQKMADLPQERLCVDNPPFTNVRVDYFGPIEVKRGRSVVKRYGVIFTCMTTRAVHLELAFSLDTDSCISALRRFIARRGTVKVIRSDNGTNFVGSARELQEEIAKWNQSKINTSLLQKGIVWEFNPPYGSHFGGIWERMIRSSRKILLALLHEQTIRLDDENIQTLLCEVEAILNGRPLTQLSDDPQDLEVLTPNHLLLLKGDHRLPPGEFDGNDCYARRRWRQVQFLADSFWKRWIKEYLPLLQERQKWNTVRRNVTKNDIVLICENSPRNSWSMGRVTDVYPDRKGFVRSVKLWTKSGELKRPIDKICVILEAEST